MADTAPETWQARRYIHDGEPDGFRGALCVRLIPDEMRQGRRLAALAEPFVYVDTLGKCRMAVVMPPGFVSDFASMPIWARPVLPAFGPWAEAAVLHDWLYVMGPPGDRAAKRRADRLFSKAMRRQKVNALVRLIMYASVRFGGGRSFGRWTASCFRVVDEPKRHADIQDCAPLVCTVHTEPAPARHRDNA
jgi:hypothetical protein